MHRRKSDRSNGDGGSPTYANDHRYDIRMRLSCRRWVFDASRKNRVHLDHRWRHDHFRERHECYRGHLEYPGSESVSVNYTDVSGCAAAIPATLPVTVNALPVPTMTGPASVCVNSSGNTYTTETGNSSYVWTLSAGGNITSGGGSVPSP